MAVAARTSRIKVRTTRTTGRSSTAPSPPPALIWPRSSSPTSPTQLPSARRSR